MVDKSINIKELDALQDKIGAWYYTLNNIPYTGCAIQYYPNGIMAAESNFVNGYQEGIQRIWFQNGQLMAETNYSNNIPHGKCIEWYEDGTLSFEAEYDMGTKIRSKTYSEQGKIVKEFP